jgi:N-acetylmuramoyl-L-alanine amidase
MVQPVFALHRMKVEAMRTTSNMRCLILVMLIGVLIMSACGGESSAALPKNTSATAASIPQAPMLPATPDDEAESTVAPTHGPTEPANATAVTETSPTPRAATSTVTTAATTPVTTHHEGTAAVSTPTQHPAPSENSGPVIVLDPGHDRTTPGAMGIEYQVVLKSAYYAKEALEAAGYQVYLTRVDNETVFVEDTELLPPNAADFHPGYSHAYAHASKALQFNPDMVIVLHFNGHPNPDVGGIEVYYCEMGGDQNLVMAEIMLEELVATVRSLGHEPAHARVLEDLTVARGNRHFPSLGNVYEAPRTFIENRYYGIPVVLTEPLYMTNAVERALIDDDATHLALADAYVRAADRYFGR